MSYFCIENVECKYGTDYKYQIKGAESGSYLIISDEKKAFLQYFITECCSK